MRSKGQDSALSSRLESTLALFLTSVVANQSSVVYLSCTADCEPWPYRHMDAPVMSSASAACSPEKSLFACSPVRICRFEVQLAAARDYGPVAANSSNINGFLTTHIIHGPVRSGAAPTVRGVRVLARRVRLIGFCCRHWRPVPADRHSAAAPCFDSLSSSLAR